ncbi:restriction endonuclease subunit S [Chryseobacterium phosphatilyticum]|uniref:Restriction endonuclease subunit S n=1 Tax=Chryseobacterium phosphatilyticum TaxID=475075 RepID=A0A316XMP4_9FLAO|nr:restriction endonuclease subunit S [Chryseobacterium phosphatilyticum]PWN72210.1 restriction endonuclease subunit S [Chryseobacterium phosphatilyticum]
MSNWKQISIGEFIDFNPHESIKKGLIARKIGMDKLGIFQRKINGSENLEYSAGPKFRNKDTLVAKITPCLENGKTAYVDNLNEDEVAFGSSEFIVLRENENSDSKFIYYLARSPLFRERAISCMEGTSGRKRVNEGALKRQEILVPTTKIEQQKIASVLSTLDDKIELNNSINTELEQMAKTLYDYWFVQFDFPNEDGKPYKSSGGKMIYNKTLKREIPQGWEVKRLEEIENNIITGKTPSTLVKDNFGGDIPFVTIDDIRKQLFIINSDRKLSEKGAGTQQSKFLEIGDICVSCIGTVGVIGIVGKKCQTNQQINTISKVKDYNRYFLLNALKKYFEFNVAAKQGAVLSNMNKGEFSDIPILDCPKEIKTKFLKIVMPFYDKLNLNLQQNQELASLRDWLLPMLMNGQVKVEN